MLRLIRNSYIYPINQSNTTLMKKAYLILRLGPRVSFEWEAELFANLVENPDKELMNISFGNVGTITFMYTDNDSVMIHAAINREYAERDLPLGIMVFTLDNSQTIINLEGNPGFKQLVMDFREMSGINERDRKIREEIERKNIDTIEFMTADDIIDLMISQFDRDINKMPAKYRERLKKLSE